MEKSERMKIHLAHILVKHRFEAEDILRQIQNGKNFKDLAMMYSTCSSAKNGGDLGLIEIKRFDEDFAEAAISIKENEISNPVRTRFGYHLILRLSN